MKESELRHSLSVMTTNYNRLLDENIMMLWWGFFSEFDAYYFKKACLNVIASSKFFPTVKEIIDAYEHVKQEDEREQFEKLKAQQKILSAEQSYCYLCNNSGYCYNSYNTANEYNSVARCICSHGKDLTIFSQSQIDREHTPEYREYYRECDKAAIKRGNNPFYIPNIQEVLKEDFVVFAARQKEQYLSSRTTNDKRKADLLESVANL